MSYDRWLEEPYILMEECPPDCPAHDNKNAECICAQLNEEAKEAMRSEY